MKAKKGVDVRDTKNRAVGAYPDRRHGCNDESG